MCNELIIKTNSQEYKVFLQDGFYSSYQTQTHHRHNYAEIHVVVNGSTTFQVGENKYFLKSGSLMILPNGIFHHCDNKEESTLHIAFQIDYPLKQVLIYNVNESIILSFIREIENAEYSQDFSKISSYITFICDYFLHNEKLQPNPITDYGFLICEFFSQHYSEKLQLCDLAKFLHLSERQTERLVKKYTGNTFRKELSATRINVAKSLMSSTKMSLTEICRYVGYESYAGFWKALNKNNLHFE